MKQYLCLMIYLGEKKYSQEQLRSMVLENKIPTTNANWENDFWQFLHHWYNESLDYIEIKTSGSTGAPKTIRHKKKYMRNSAKSTCTYFNLDKSKTALLCLPLSSVGGIMLLVRALVSEINLYIEKPSSNPLKNNSNIFDFIAVVPFQLNTILKQNPKAARQVKQWLIGGGAVSSALRKQIIALKIQAFSSFGMTETISHIAINTISKNNIYEAINGVYFTQNEANCLVINAPHIGVQNLATNDIVKLHNATHFEWLGRKDLAIETGGVKILPERVEAQLEKVLPMPFFISSVPDALLNNKVILVIESTTKKVNTEDLKPYLSKYELPKKIYYVKKMIYTHSGKIDRRSTMALIKYA